MIDRLPTPIKLDQNVFLDKKVCGKVICVVKRKKISREDDYPDSVPSSTGPSPHNSTTNTFNAFKTNLAAA